MSETTLNAMLENIAAMYDEKTEAETTLKAIKQRIEDAEKVAVELLAASGLDGVRAAGKSWYLRDFWSVSILTDRKAEAVEIAKANGLDDYVTVNTASLKSWLAERYREHGATGESLAAGTPFDGLVSEYHETRLSRQTLS